MTGADPEPDDGADSADTSTADTGSTVTDAGEVTSSAGPDAEASCSGVTVQPGDDVADVLDDHFEGTTFCLAPRRTGCRAR